MPGDKRLTPREGEPPQDTGLASKSRQMDACGRSQFGFLRPGHRHHQCSPKRPPQRDELPAHRARRERILPHPCGAPYQVIERLFRQGRDLSFGRAPHSRHSGPRWRFPVSCHSCRGRPMSFLGWNADCLLMDRGQGSRRFGGQPVWALSAILRHRCSRPEASASDRGDRDPAYPLRRQREPRSPVHGRACNCGICTVVRVR